MSNNNLALYFGSNSSHSIRFIRNIIKNMNNSKNITNTIDKEEKNFGYIIEIRSISSLYINPKEIVVNSRNKYFLRYFINSYNLKTRKQYGNTYRSPLIPVKINENDLIEFYDNNPFYAYVLSQEPKNDNLVVQIILVETTYDEVILKEKCLGWTLVELYLEDQEKNEKNFTPERVEIYGGTSRELLFKNDIVPMRNTIFEYYSYKYPNLQLISFLLPNNIVLAYNEPLPGLNLRSLPQIPNTNEVLKTVHFITAYIKNLNIEINSELEDNILQFGREYRLEKYKIKENETNKVFIKERKIKCGIHNTWKFINTNGLQNSITLSKINKNKLESNGVLMIDKFFVDSLSCSSIIMELEYILTIPINGPQKEDNLSLIIGYHIYVPEKINLGNYYKEKVLMFTGPGITIYGDKMWQSENLGDKNIYISYILSQNDNLAYTSSRDIEFEANKEKLQNIQKNIIDQNNQMVLNNMEINKNNENKIIELENKIKYLQNELLNSNEMNNRDIRDRRRALLNQDLDINEPRYRSINNNNYNYNDNYSPMEKIKKEESVEYKEFIIFKERKEVLLKEIDEQESRLKDVQKPHVKEYEPMIKNISSRDKSNLISKGVLDLEINYPVESLIEYALEKELSSHGLATIFTFQFLAFKPSQKYYKDLRNVPEKIQFFFDFFHIKKLKTSVCNIVRPESVSYSNYYHFNNPLILKQENSNINTNLLNDSKEDIIIEIRYDPSMDNSIDFRDFVKYLFTKRMVVQIKDVQKSLNIGCIKIPLKDLVAQGKDKIPITKEYMIYDDNFKERGCIQLLITATKINTIRPYSYNRDIFKNINSKEGYNTLSRKKKIKVEKMDINKLMSQNKNLYNYTVTNINDHPKNNNNLNENNNIEKEMNHNYTKELRIEKDLEKKLRVMKYFSNKANIGNQNMMNKTNYSMGFGGNLHSKENNLNELRQKQKNEQNFLNTLKTCEQIRDFNRREIISKVSQETHKNSYNISLIMGQPIFFNYSIFNDSEYEENFHISIELNSNNKKNNNNISERYINNNNRIVSVVSVPQEWSSLVEKEKLIKPNNYDVISDDLNLQIKPGETIPLIIKLLSFIENKEEEKYSVCIHKKNGEPLYFLNINIKRVFPIYDHIFHYYLPCDNKNQNVILVNPFKNRKTKTMEMLNNLYIPDGSILLALDYETHDFNFKISQENNIYYNTFIIFLYLDKERTKLYLTWKIQIEWREVFDIQGTLGVKSQCILYVKYDEELHSQSIDSSSKNMNLQLFTNKPNTIFFPPDYDKPFIISPREQKKMKFVFYPKIKEDNLILINCVNVYTRELYKKWMIKSDISEPQIDKMKKIDFVIGTKNIFDLNYQNPFDNGIILFFYSGNEENMEVIDKIVSFNPGESKDVKLSIHDKGNIGKEEVLLFISDDGAQFCQTILFVINFRENK